MCVFCGNPWKRHGNSLNQLVVLRLLDVNPRKQHCVFYGDSREQHGNSRNQLDVLRLLGVNPRKQHGVCFTETYGSNTETHGNKTEATRCVFRRNPWEQHGNSRNRLDVFRLLDVNPRKQHGVCFTETHGSNTKTRRKNRGVRVSQKSMEATRKLPESNGRSSYA